MSLSVNILLFNHSVVSDFVTPWTTAHQTSVSFTTSRSLLKLMSIKSVMPSNHLTFCHLLLLWPSVFSSIRISSNELALQILWPKYWSFCLSISPSNEYSELISFRIDWFDHLGVQRTLNNLQHTVQNHQFFTLNLFYCPALTSVHNYWENYSFDYMDLCRQKKTQKTKL